MLCTIERDRSDNGHADDPTREVTEDAHQPIEVAEAVVAAISGVVVAVVADC